MTYWKPIWTGKVNFNIFQRMKVRILFECLEFALVTKHVRDLSTQVSLDCGYRKLVANQTYFSFLQLFLCQVNVLWCLAIDQ